MSSGGGVFAVSRAIWDHPNFSGEAFTRREAWLWLISSAAWKDCRVRIGAGQVNLARGEFAFSVRFLAQRWGWSKSRVDRVLSVFEKQDMVRDVSRDGHRVYSICNYNDFQFAPGNGGTARGTQGGTEAGHERDKEEEGNKVIIEDILSGPPAAGADVVPIADADFETFWKAYRAPPNSKKPDARRAWTQTASKRPSLDSLLRAVAAYQSWLAEQSGKQCREYPKQHPATWLRGEVWQGYLQADITQAADEIVLRKAWNGRAAALVDEIGAAKFAAWFDSSRFEAGPPPRILVAKPFTRNWIEQHYSSRLRRLYGDVSIEVAKAA